jgi:hypothetical protein
MVDATVTSSWAAMAAWAALCAVEKVVPSPTPTKLYLIEYCGSSPVANHVGSPTAKTRERLMTVLKIIFIIKPVMF